MVRLLCSSSQVLRDTDNSLSVGKRQKWHVEKGRRENIFVN